MIWCTVQSLINAIFGIHWNGCVISGSRYKGTILENDYFMVISNKSVGKISLQNLGATS